MISVSKGINNIYLHLSLFTCRNSGRMHKKVMKWLWGERKARISTVYVSLLLPCYHQRDRDLGIVNECIPSVSNNAWCINICGINGYAKKITQLKNKRNMDSL